MSLPCNPFLTAVIIIFFLWRRLFRSKTTLTTDIWPTQLNNRLDTLHNDTLHEGLVCDIQHDDIQHNDVQHNNTLVIKLNVIVLGVSFLIVMLNVVAPGPQLGWPNIASVKCLSAKRFSTQRRETLFIIEKMREFYDSKIRRNKTFFFVSSCHLYFRAIS
jgi:hypothetical protein